MSGAHAAGEGPGPPPPHVIPAAAAVNLVWSAEDISMVDPCPEAVLPSPCKQQCAWELCSGASSRAVPWQHRGA